MDINIKVIPHSEQRYPTVGDWYPTANGVEILVSSTGDWRYDTLVALHEFVECVLCAHYGVSEAAVTSFDFTYEIARQTGDVSEPGDDPSAPYHEQHKAATTFEKCLADCLGVNWTHYEDTLNTLGNPQAGDGQ